jgi:TPR repeat protein
MKKYLFILTIIILISCKQKSINTSLRSDKDLKDLVCLKGDTVAYEELSNVYIDYGYKDFLPYALIMANKYNYPQACFDVYFCLWDIYGKTGDIFLDDLDSTTQKMAIFYLRKGIELGHCQSMQTLGKFYISGKYVGENIELGEQLIKKGDSLQNIW